MNVTREQREPLLTVGGFLRQLGFAALVGLAVGLLLWILNGQPVGALAPQVVGAAWFGVCIYTLCLLGMVLFRRTMSRLSEGRRRWALGAIFFVAGGLAWILGMLTLPWVTFGWLQGARMEHWTRPALFTGVLGVLLGLTFYSFALLQERLRDSVARLKEQEFAERELATARDIQRRLLPPAQMDCCGYRVVARSVPARVVAGDLYDVFTLPDGSFVAAVGDVSGKGMGASLRMASVKAMLPLVAAAQPTAAATLAEINRRLAEDLGPREFVALALVRFAPDSGRFQLANGGLPDPYRLRTADGHREVLEVPGPRLPLGVRRETAYEQLEGHLEAGERLLLLSDGLPEALTAAGEPLGYERLQELLPADGCMCEEWMDRLFAAVTGAAAAEPEDDWTALLLERPVRAVAPASVSL